MQIAFLPLDDRPVNYDAPRYLARAAGCEILLPEREWLGTPWRASQHEKLVDWCAQAALSADVLIVALDTLAYGGLIPSRTSCEVLESVLQRLAILRMVKKQRPALPIFASSVIQRISRADSSEEEKDYWAIYGSRMFRLSYLEHKQALGEADAAESVECAELRRSIPQEVYQDYRRGRSRNHAVNQAMLDWTQEGIFDYLILPQDDTAQYGWNIAEARALQAGIRSWGLSDRAITYPGTDEIGCLLLAACLCRQRGFQPRVWPRYSSITSPAVITAYEDRPIHELLKAHLAPLGGRIASSPQEADLLLYINAPAQAQGEGFYQWVVWKGVEALRQDLTAEYHAFLDEVQAERIFQNTRREMESPTRSPEELVRALWADVASGRSVALADVAFVNGADLILGNMLAFCPEIARLAAFGGWNTAGNTLGMVLAQAVIRGLDEDPNPEQDRAHLEFLFMRFLDDYCYQARERSRLMLEDLPRLGMAPSMERLADAEIARQVEARVQQRLLGAARELEKTFVRSGLVNQVQVSGIYLPWQRLFEVGFEVWVC